VSTDDLILSKTRAIIERIAGPERTPVQIGPDTPLADGFWLDSVELLEVAIACEVEFGIVFDDTRDLQSEAFNTLGTLAGLIRAKQSATQ
jgi:acyl carrier protein